MLILSKCVEFPVDLCYRFGKSDKNMGWGRIFLVVFYNWPATVDAMPGKE